MISNLDWSYLSKAHYWHRGKPLNKSNQNLFERHIRKWHSIDSVPLASFNALQINLKSWVQIFLIRHILTVLNYNKWGNFIVWVIVVLYRTDPHLRNKTESYSKWVSSISLANTWNWSTLRWFNITCVLKPTAKRIAELCQHRWLLAFPWPGEDMIGPTFYGPRDFNIKIVQEWNVGLIRLSKKKKRKLKLFLIKLNVAGRNSVKVYTNGAGTNRICCSRYLKWIITIVLLKYNIRLMFGIPQNKLTALTDAVDTLKTTNGAEVTPPPRPDCCHG